MPLFGRDSQPKEQPKLEDEIFDFPFEVLWQDEVQSNFLQYIPHVVEIVLLVWLLIKL